MKKVAEILGLLFIGILGVSLPLSILTLLFYALPVSLGLPLWLGPMIGGSLVLIGALMSIREMKVIAGVMTELRDKCQMPPWLFVVFYPVIYLQVWSMARLVEESLDQIKSN